MKLLSLVLLAALAMGANAQTTKTWFIFLVKGPGQRPDSATVETMQTAHIANFKRLFGLKKLLGAGPLEDPTTVRRGIVVLSAPDLKNLHECFLPDPYVQAKLMNLDAHVWFADLHGLNSNDPDPEGIEENRIAILTGRRKPPEFLVREHQDWIAQRVRPSVGGPLESADFREVLLFHGTDHEEQRKALESDPLVRLGWAKMEWMPLWMSKGAIRDR